MKKIYLSVLMGIVTLQLSAQTYNGGTWYSLYDTQQHTNVVVTSTIVEYKNIFAPTNGNFTFDYKKYSIATINGYIAVFESSNGGKNENGLGDIAYSDYKNWKSGSKTTAANINYIRLQNNSTGVEVKNAKLPLAQHILLADGTYGTTEYTDAFDFGSTKWGETSAKIDTIALRSFLTAGNITITSSIPSVFRINSKTNTSGVSYQVGSNSCASSNGSAEQACADGVLGDINLYGFRIFFCPQEAKTYTGTITISDGTNSATIAVTGKGLKQDQTITFDPVTPIYDTATIAPATVSSQLEPTYTFNPENVVSFEGGKFVITPLSDSAQVTITVAQAGNSNYNAATTVEKIITIYPSKTYGSFTTSVCKGEQVEYDGKWYGAGEYKEILISIKNMYGSDSLVTLTVNELPTYLVQDTLTYTLTDSLIWRERPIQVERKAGEYDLADTLKTIDGCDSIFTLHLILKKAEQAIEFALTSDTIKIGDTLTLSAMSTSGLQITYMFSPDNLSSLEGTTLTALLSGELVITASQEGDSIYLPAESVSRTLIIVDDQPSYIREITNEQDKVNKQMRNGQLLIIRNGQLFNAQGAEIR